MYKWPIAKYLFPFAQKPYGTGNIPQICRSRQVEEESQMRAIHKVTAESICECQCPCVHVHVDITANGIVWVRMTEGERRHHRRNHQQQQHFHSYGSDQCEKCERLVKWNCPPKVCLLLLLQHIMMLLVFRVLFYYFATNRCQLCDCCTIQYVSNTLLGSI